MSENFDRIPDALIAVGLGANKGFWMIQPRDDEGQWIEMGAHVIFRFRTGKGNLVVATQHGVYVGPSGKPGFARVLIPKDTPEGLKAGVYDIESRNLQQFKAIIPGLDGESSNTRLDKFGKPVQTLEDAKLPALNDLLKTAKAITPQDERLAKGELTPEEKSAEADARKNSPLADKPAGFENTNPDEAAKLLKDAGADISTSEPVTTETPAAVKPASVAKKSKSSSESAPLPGTAEDRAPLDEIMAEVAYNGDTKKTVDDLIKEEQGLALARETSTTEKAPLDLNPGDVIVNSRGDEFTVLGISLGNASEGIPAQIRVQAPNGDIGQVSHPMNQKLNVATGRRGQVSRPSQPRPDVNKVNTPAKDKSESTKTEKAPVSDSGEMKTSDGLEVVPTAPGLQPANFPPKDRLDDGSEFELPKLTDQQINEARAMRLDPLLDPDGTPAKYVDENNKVVDAEDPFAMMAALAKVYPNAKFTSDGALILHRQKDSDGRIFELRANNSGKKAIIYSMRWTDPATGDYKEYQHKDDRHSITALFRKDNGPQDLLDRLLGRTDNKGKSWATLKFGNSSWGPSDSLFKRLKWFMSGTGDRKKMEDIASNAVRLAKGREAVYHKDGTIKNSEIPSLWEAFSEYYGSAGASADRDPELRDNLYQNLYGVFGRMPLDEKSHALARTALRNEFARQFPDRSVTQTRAFNGLVTSASERMRGIFREPDSQVRSIRYASKDRTRPIESGMAVEYTNNVGETSTVKVASLVENINATPGNLASYDYGDYVVIQDANGRKVTINALKLKIMQDQNSALTSYRPNLWGDALRQKRIEQGVWTPTTERAARPNSRLSSGPSIQPIAGQNTVLSDPPPAPKLIDDFVPGEMLYNKEGRPLGIIKATRAITGRDGQPGMAFLYNKPDGTEGQVAYALGTEITPKKA